MPDENQTQPAAPTPPETVPGGVPAPVAFEDVHAFRKEIDAVIQKGQALQQQIAASQSKGGREVALVVTKLQEGKMWAGKILEAIGSPFPPELADKADPAPAA